MEVWYSFIYMMVFILIFSALFTFVTWYRFHYGLFLFLLFLPTYLIRFHIGLLPTTLLEVMLWIIMGVWSFNTARSLSKKNTSLSEKQVFLSRLRFLISEHPSLCIAMCLFLLGATISVFTAVDMRAALGEWKAFYIEPILFFIILITTIPKTRSVVSLITPLVLLGLVTGILATIQHFTGWMVPWAFWENGGSYRVTGWYGFPNGVGLFLAPIAILCVYVFYSTILPIIKKNRAPQQRMSILVLVSIISFFSFIFCIFGVVFAKSTGGLIGIAAGIGFLLIMNHKTRIPTFILSVAVMSCILFMPRLAHIKQEVLAQDRSGQLRVDMWAEATQYLSEHPIVGTGLASYKTAIYPYRVDKWIEVFHHPHNIFLTIWVNTGLIGLVGFVWILVWFFRVGFSQIIQQKNISFFILCLLGTIITVVTTGLVDSPYIKNDLSIFFWVLVALMVCMSLPPNISRT